MLVYTVHRLLLIIQNPVRHYTDECRRPAIGVRRSGGAGAGRVARNERRRFGRRRRTLDRPRRLFFEKPLSLAEELRPMLVMLAKKARAQAASETA